MIYGQSAAKQYQNFWFDFVPMIPIFIKKTDIMGTYRGVIYKYTSPSGKSYIGQTTNEQARKRRFLQENETYSGHKIANAKKKYGPENFVYEVLSDKTYNNKKEMINDLNHLESYYIGLFDTYKNGYNMTYGGEGVRGLELSNESIEKIKKTMLSKYSEYNDGLRYKVRQKKEKKLKTYTKKGLGMVGTKNPFYGKHHSDETKMKISQNNGKEVVQIDKDTNCIISFFNSAHEASNSLGSQKGNSEILKVCRGYISPSGKHFRTALGYKWKYRSDIEGSTTIGKDGKMYFLPPSTSTSQANGDGSGEHPSVGEDIV